MITERGTLYRTDGSASWGVTDRVQMTAGPGSDSISVTGTIEFDSGRELWTDNSQAPVYLHLSDGLWARLYLPLEDSDGLRYMIGPGSQLIGRPTWARNA